jgi:hypothetical protein
MMSSDQVSGQVQIGSSSDGCHIKSGADHISTYHPFSCKMLDFCARGRHRTKSGDAAISWLLNRPEVVPNAMPSQRDKVKSRLPMLADLLALNDGS